jgi:hypothetical protein
MVGRLSLQSEPLWFSSFRDINFNLFSVIFYEVMKLLTSKYLDETCGIWMKYQLFIECMYIHKKCSDSISRSGSISTISSSLKVKHLFKM